MNDEHTRGEQLPLFPPRDTSPLSPTTSQSAAGDSFDPVESRVGDPPQMWVCGVDRESLARLNRIHEQRPDCPLSGGDS